MNMCSTLKWGQLVAMLIYNWPCVVGFKSDFGLIHTDQPDQLSFHLQILFLCALVIVSFIILNLLLYFYFSLEASPRWKLSDGNSLLRKS